MKSKSVARRSIARAGAIATLSLAVFSFCPAAYAQTPARSAAADTSPAALAKLAADLDAARVKAGIPGMALVVVQGDHVVLLKGFGKRDVAAGLPVTPDTLFAIGSSTKAFTALTVLMAAGDGKLSLSDSPKKYLPYFHLSDPDADKAITLRDLMCHRSGLARTDLAMITGKLNREELIRLAGVAKPTARLGEKFQYQNIMFAAAGEAAAVAEKTPYETLVTRRIFAPLGMTHSNFSVAAMQKAPDYSRGYRVSKATNKAIEMPQRDISATAPAGAINSSARDLARWLRFQLRGDGAFAGHKLVSQALFDESHKPQMTVGGSMSYGLGWFLESWQGHKVIEHGGNIDGFSTAVAFMPDENLGFALLINDNDAALGPQSLGMVWQDLIGGGAKAVSAAGSEAGAPTIDAASLPGAYSHAAPAFSITVAAGPNGALTLVAPGQAPYPLEHLGGDRYKLGDPAPAGFYVTFRHPKGTTDAIEMYLEQPQGNFTLEKDRPATPSTLSPALQALTGDYEKDGHTVTLTGSDGKLALIVPGQPTYPLDPAPGKPNIYTCAALPAGFAFEITRDSAGAVTGLIAHQPNGDFSFSRVATADAAALPSLSELRQKMIAAYGGQKNLESHHTRLTTMKIDFENEGVTADGAEWMRAPDARASHLELHALGKTIGTIDEFGDGATAASWSSFSPYVGKEGGGLSNEKREDDFTDGLLDGDLYDASAEVRRLSKVGDEPVYVLVETPKDGGTPITSFISTKTYLLLRRDDSDADSGLPETTLYSDYRVVAGVEVPFRIELKSPTGGTVVSTVKEVHFDAAVPDAVFAAPKGAHRD